MKYIIYLQLGPTIIAYLGGEAKESISWIARHIGYDSLRDALIWLLYSDLTPEGQRAVARSGIFVNMFSRLCTWQRTLSWGVGTTYQRDSIENICILLQNILYPPAVSTIGDIITYVDPSQDAALPLISGQASVADKNNLLRNLLQQMQSSDDHLFGTFLDLGYAELKRQVELVVNFPIHEGGALSIVMMLMSTLSYHKRHRELGDIESLLLTTKKILIKAIVPRVESFVHLCEACAIPHTPHTTAGNGSAFLSIVTFLKRCIFLQSAAIDAQLAKYGCIPCLLSCYTAHPSNSLMHHELTDVVRFLLLDPTQSRLPSCPLLHSLFITESSILDLVVMSYAGDSTLQYRGHMTTIANRYLFE